jgi:arsenite-transporting ATPase
VRQRVRPWRHRPHPAPRGCARTTCAAAAALGLAGDRAVALHSTDPAGSLADVLGREVGTELALVTERLRAQQVDAGHAFDAWRAEYRDDVGAVFVRLGIEENVALDRRVIEAALDLAPLGIDEIVALDQMLDALDRDEVLVIDTAPTGHFLRLLEMPELALEWAHALLRILLRYGGAAQLDDVSARVLAFAKRLKALRAQLTDPEVTGVFVVTLDEPMVRAETDRLRAALRAANVPEAAVLLNRAASGATFPAPHVIRAPDCATPPAGADALRAFFQQWELA